MKKIKIFSVFVLGALFGFFIQLLSSQFTSTTIIVVNKQLVGDNGRVLQKGTILTYEGGMPEGYLKANMAIAIEGKALKEISISTDERPNLRNQYFYSDVE